MKLKKKKKKKKKIAPFFMIITEGKLPTAIYKVNTF